MTERPIPPDFMWPSKAAEKFRFLLFSDRTIPWGEPGSKSQYQEARTLLLQALATGRIRASFMCKTSGTTRALPGRFWYTDSQLNAWHGDFLLLSDVPRPQNWQFDDSPPFYGTYGYALVNEASLRAYFEELSSGPSDGLPTPKDGETNQDYVLRALGLNKPRRIGIGEARALARPLLCSRNKPVTPDNIESLAESLTASMRGLAK
jgi:hypothetical protein